MSDDPMNAPAKITASLAPDATGEQPAEAYCPRRPSASRFIDVRGLRHHVLTWGDEALVTPARPALVMLHGWMDVAASFQFVVDAMADDRHVIAFDWRGFGLTDTPAGDTYWIPDYVADLDAVLDALQPGAPIDLVGHSMGGNVVMLYAGLRPQRIRRLVNLEGFGMPRTQPGDTPKRFVDWLDDLKKVHELRPYPSLKAVATRLKKTNPLLRSDRATWLAGQWSRQQPQPLTQSQHQPQLQPQTRSQSAAQTELASQPPASAQAEAWAILADPAHKRSAPTRYEVEDVLAIWKLITAPLMWVEGDQTDTARWWGKRYTKAEFHQRLEVVGQVEKHVLSPAGHMLHHDQPEALARLLEAFLDA